MSKQSPEYHLLVRQVARRRRSLLLDGRGLLYPPLGEQWTPSDKETTLCEAFITLFVAELETYFEWALEEALSIFEQSLRASGNAECSAAESYIGKIREKQKVLAKNNNANWKRLSEFFEFIGLTQGKFPDDFWDKVEIIVQERGGIVHRSFGARLISDPRLTIDHIEKTVVKLKIFDKDFYFWLNIRRRGIDYMKSTSYVFTPGLGTLGV